MAQMLFDTERIEDCREGSAHVLANIDVCHSVAAFLATTLGPYGRDKLFYGDKLLLTNDGATILQNMQYTHPIARLLVDISRTQDREIGDGTTSVVLLAAELLSALAPLVREGYATEMIVEELRALREECVTRLADLAVPFTSESARQAAETCLCSKSIASERAWFAELLVRALQGDGQMHICKVPGGALRDSALVEGIAFEKTFTYAGYEQQPRRIERPRICCLNIELEWKSERDNAEMRIRGIDEYKRVVNAEWQLIDEKIADIVASGATVVLSALPIGDYATQCFAARGIFSAGRVPHLERIITAFGGRITSSTKHIELCSCDLFEERQVGGIRCNYFEGHKITTRTLILRGPGTEALEEVERAVHDAECIVRAVLRSEKIVCGGGAVEMQMSRVCRERAFVVEGERLFICQAVARAFERLPQQLASNAGMDPLVVVQQLRRAHSAGTSAGVGQAGVADMREAGVLEPLAVKRSMFDAAFSLAEVVLGIDSTIVERRA